MVTNLGAFIFVIIAVVIGVYLLVWVSVSDKEEPFSNSVAESDRQRAARESVDPRERAKWEAARRAQRPLHERLEGGEHLRPEAVEQSRGPTRSGREAAIEGAAASRSPLPTSTENVLNADPGRWEQKRRWASVRRRFRDAQVRMASYETDPTLAIDYPAFNDVAVPEVRTMVSALRRAAHLLDASDTGAEIGGSKELLLELETAVLEFISAIDGAERAARRLRWSHLGESDRKDLEQIRALLAHAESSGNTDEARRGYYAQLGRVIRRLNDRNGHPVVPAGAMVAIEDSARLALG